MTTQTEQTEQIKDYKNGYGFEINWNCGHRWVSWNTTLNPDKDKKALKFGCPYCNCKKGKLTYTKMRKEVLK